MEGKRLYKLTRQSQVKTLNSISQVLIYLWKKKFKTLKNNKNKAILADKESHNTILR